MDFRNTFFVKQISGHTTEIQCDPSLTIGRLKTDLSLTLNVNVDDIRLIREGKGLSNDDVNLEQANITPGVTVFAVFRLRQPTNGSDPNVAAAALSHVASGVFSNNLKPFSGRDIPRDDNGIDTYAQVLQARRNVKL